MPEEINFYASLYAENTQSASQSETIVQDAAIGKPWTHRITLYCANPSTDFLAELKKNECVLAFYEKQKKETPSIKGK